MHTTSATRQSAIEQSATDRPAEAQDARPTGTRRTVPLTVIVPAYNESEHIADTVASILSQTVAVAEILVVDDGSTDDTGARATAAGATVLRPPVNTGSKAGAQNYALSHVQTELTMAIDADTTLAPDAIETLLPAMEAPNISAACGFVVPRHVRTVWERGRYVEYLFAFGFYKSIQDYFDRPLIASGCFSAYRTEALRAVGGWPVRTMTEDMDLTWTFYGDGRGVRFVPQAVCYPVEPHNFTFMAKQLRRWSHGFVQNVRLHWRNLLHLPYLRTFVAVAMWDAVVASLVYLVVIPLLSVLVTPLFLLGYVVDGAVVMVPVVVTAWRRREVGKALASMPAFFVLRTVNALFLVEALWTELVLRRPLKTYEKGH